MQFDREAESSGLDHSVSEKAVLLFNQALIHMRVLIHTYTLGLLVRGVAHSLRLNSFTSSPQLHQNSQAIAILEQLFKVCDALSKQDPLSLSPLSLSLFLSEKEPSSIDWINSNS